MEKNAEEMRMGVFRQERGEISAFLYAGFPQVLETLKSPGISKLDSRAWKSPGIL